MGLESAALIAVAVYAHAWVHKLSAPPPVVNACGWVVSALAVLVIGSQWVHCS